MDQVMERDRKDGAMKLETSIRCVKAAHLLYSLSMSKSHRLQSEVLEKEAKWIRETYLLRRALMRERVKNRKSRICSLIEHILQIEIFLLLLILCWMIW
ncbi:uncharacterized protein LOC124910819 [Impatiens glandulifera]|uniref:uncharacterized protein LOC124910819 n=1 Tax=Impatiens glandulifera TaxID=253017 RepID=UPI001FB1A0D2|nr:uncharacterized protein LOC124910819 [Impatiens glandulifera]